MRNLVGLSDVVFVVLWRSVCNIVDVASASGNVRYT